jgi:hypothetical protein
MYRNENNDKNDEILNPYASIPHTLTKAGTMMTCHLHPRYKETNTYGNLSNNWKIVLLMC